MREIELGKLLGEKPQPNIVKFIGCVTTKGKQLKQFLLVNAFTKMFQVSVPDQRYMFSDKWKVIAYFTCILKC